ncbi:hypothetical protein AB0F92_24920 [Kitasatospora aureofaciens]|uniref:Secreted protein n=1 Tax=Kitasatospora aureofaciens TaxID=1894 RepID=A0A1E7MV28_KITAU|nr:hypothetical protein [Kitasatospora aureofaciens]OEV32284.1 hypothetical protein HS99_0016350 [Kitasatospora aureofaciens]UKZ10444.1 hypothetical protein BOQ63_041830 [Streptomyces viridifaciens]
MFIARRVVRAVAVALLAAVGLLLLSPSASAYTREPNRPRPAMATKLAEEAVTPKCVPGPGWTRPRNVRAPQHRPELRPALDHEAPAADHPSQDAVPEPPHRAARQDRTADLQVFRC